MRRFEIVKDGEVIAAGVEFEVGPERPAVAASADAWPVTYRQVAHVPLAYGGGDVRWLDGEGS